MTSGLISDPARVEDIARAVRAAGRVAMDLEFVSEDRYIPDLSLVQLAWGEAGEPELAAVDPLATDPRPVLDLVSDPDVDVIMHGAKQDLALIAYRFDLGVARFWDTQIAAAFAGIAEQIGYGKLVARLLGVRLDKASQFTNWARRPLQDSQLRYALDDVRYLLGVWDALREKLEPRGRLAWVAEESLAMARDAATRPPPEEVFRTLGGHANLKGPALASLRSLAAWRERKALADNTPPSWLIPDGAMVEACRRRVKSERELRRIRGVGPGTMRKQAGAILEAIAAGAGDEPPEVPQPPAPLDARGQTWSQASQALVYGAAIEAGIALRLVASRSEIELLVRWHAEGRDAEAGESLRLLSGWRRELVGERLLAWLAGDIGLRATPTGVTTG